MMIITELSGLGSSPRVWGQVALNACISPAPRIIPTRVGTRQSERYAKRRRGDHPHACGDKQLLLSRTFPTLGSSPRVWGQVKARMLMSEKNGIIPTRVGTSYSSAFNCSHQQDHPHACGDKQKDSTVSEEEVGSSPRVWGQDALVPTRHHGERIIPTRVGTRLSPQDLALAR